jgi:hypothetical protein
MSRYLLLCSPQYMDRTYVTQQHKTPVFQLGLDLWREQVRQRCSSSGSVSSRTMEQRKQT